jgi:2-haloacid dehalogenase
MKTQEKRLKKSGLINLFNGVFISDVIGFDKPNKNFFDFVLNNIEPCSKNEILIVGDSLSSDIQGGNNIGIKCCWYNPCNRVNDTNLIIDYEIHNLSELLEFI